MDSNLKSPESPFRASALNRHVVLVTGGGSGIGLEIARQLGLHGAKVALMGRREAVLATAVKALEAEGVQACAVTGDVRNYEDCERAVKETVGKFGSLSILVNCAAGNFLAAVEDLSSKGFRTVMEIDTLGVFNMSRAAFPELRAAGSSTVINISATLHYAATWFQAHASAAKAAIDSLTRSLALEWGEYGIRVNGIAPGPIADTAGMTKLGGGLAESMWANKIPLRRPGTKWDIAMCAVYLASDAGAFVSGHTVVVDGGEWFGHQPFLSRDAVRSFSKQIEGKSRATGLASAAPQSKL